MALTAISTTAGAVRQVNEDSVCVKVASSRFGEVVMVVVCDGVGGLSAGEVASASVVAAFSRWFEESLGAYLMEHVEGAGDASAVDLEGMRAEWGSLLLSMNSAIHRYGSERDVSLGTTVSAILLCGERYVTAQVGDTRIYLAHGSQVRQVTADQTYVAREVARGRMSAEEAANHPRRNVLLQAVGAQEKLSPEYVVGTVSPGDGIVACTDGFYHSMTPEALTGLASAVQGGQGAMQRELDGLVQRAMGGGETDNISAVFVAGLGASQPDDSTTTLLGNVDGSDVLGGSSPASFGQADDDETGTLPHAQAGAVVPPAQSPPHPFDDARTSRIIPASLYDDDTTAFLVSQPSVDDRPTGDLVGGEF